MIAAPPLMPSPSREVAAPPAAPAATPAMDTCSRRDRLEITHALATPAAGSSPSRAPAPSRAMRTDATVAVARVLAGVESPGLREFLTGWRPAKAPARRAPFRA